MKNEQAEAVRRNATSTVEVVVSIALLAAATTMVGAFVHRVKVGLRDREFSTRCDWELMNARERIGSWPNDQITLEQIRQIPMSKSLAEQNARLAAAIQLIEEPVPATQVTLAIECERNGQTMQPSVVTFWIPTRVEGNP